MMRWALSVLLLLSGHVALARESIQYASVDRATVRVMAMGTVGIYEYPHPGGRVVLASPVGGHGSGFVVQKSGLIVTAAHVVQGARALAVHVSGLDTAVPATAVYVDAMRDVAFLRIAYPLNDVVQLAAPGSQQKVRDPVFAVGFPLDATRSDPQSSRGVLSGRLPDGRLQLSISLNPGNSGGPVIDQNERVFGVVSARSNVQAGAIGLAAAVPIESFRNALEQEMRRPPAVPPSAGEQRLARLVSLFLHEGESLVRGSTQLDSVEAMRTDAQVRQLVSASPGSADAALLGAAFFWNRHVALQLHQRSSQAARTNAVKLARYALRLDPRLRDESRFLGYLLSLPGGFENVPAQPSPSLEYPPRSVSTLDSNPSSGVFFEADREQVSLHLRLSPNTNAERYEWVCGAPCSREVRPGRYRVALSWAQRDPVDVERPLEVSGRTKVMGRYQSRRGLRAAGWVTMFTGGALGLLVSSTSEERCDFDVCTVTYPYFWVGTLISGAAVGGGLAMILQGDKAEIDVVPGVAGGLPRGALALGRERGVPTGMTLRARF